MNKVEEEPQDPLWKLMWEALQVRFPQHGFAMRLGNSFLALNHPEMKPWLWLTILLQDPTLIFLTFAAIVSLCIGVFVEQVSVSFASWNWPNVLHC